MIDKKDILEKHEQLIKQLRYYAPFEFEEEKRTCYFSGANVALSEVGFDYDERIIVIEAAKEESDDENEWFDPDAYLDEEDDLVHDKFFAMFGL